MNLGNINHVEKLPPRTVGVNEGSFEPLLGSCGSNYSQLQRLLTNFCANPLFNFLNLFQSFGFKPAFDKTSFNLPPTGVPMFNFVFRGWQVFELLEKCFVNFPAKFQQFFAIGIKVLPRQPFGDEAVVRVGFQRARDFRIGNLPLPGGGNLEREKMVDDLKNVPLDQNHS